MSIWIYFAVPLAVIPLVMLLGFVGCGLSDEGQAIPEVPYHTVIETTPQLVAYWPLGEPSGTTAHDVVGPPPNGSHPGTYGTWTAAADAVAQTDAAEGELTLDQPGLLSTGDERRRSVAVNGGYVEVPFAAQLNTPEFSVELFVQTDWDATAMAAYRCVFATRELAGANIAGFILYANPTNNWEARLGVGTPTTAIAAAGDPPIPLGTTEFLAVTYNGIALNLYVNGDLRSSVKPDPPETAYVPNTSRPLLIGARERDDLVEPSFPFKGRLQEVAYYSRELSQDEIVAHLKASGI